MCYNEENTITSVIQECLEVLKKISSPNYELIIVNDGSSDQSLDKIHIKTRSNPRVKLIIHKKNLGIGPALRSGYLSAKNKNICMVPGDAQFHLKELENHSHIPEDHVISFYRESRLDYSWYRIFISEINRYINKIFLRLNIQDVNWIKIYQKNLLDRLDLRLRSSLVESEICAKAKILGFKFQEYPSQYLFRQAGKSKGSNFKIVTMALSETIKLIYYVYMFKFGSGSK